MANSSSSERSAITPGKARKPQSLADQVYYALRGQIIHGQIAPGAKLVELDIAADMGTSQGPVREALQRLQRDGLVERQAHSATYVTPISTDEIYELFSIRSVVEGFAIRHTLSRITPAQVAELERLIEAMRAAGRQDDMVELSQHDMDFHLRIIEWSGSRVLRATWLPLFSQIQRFVSQNHPHYFRDLLELADTHLPIMDAIRRKDTDQAAQLLQAHIMLIWTRMNTNPPPD